MSVIVENFRHPSREVAIILLIKNKTGTLKITFISGKTYLYLCITPSTPLQILQHISYGEFYEDGQCDFFSVDSPLARSQDIWLPGGWREI